MACGIGNGHGGALRDPQQRKFLKALGIHHRLEIPHEGLKTYVRDLPVGKAVASPIVAMARLTWSGVLQNFTCCCGAAARSTGISSGAASGLAVALFALSSMTAPTKRKPRRAIVRINRCRSPLSPMA